MDRESQTATAGTSLAEQLGRVGLWTRHLDVQPTDQLRTTLVELEKLGWRSLWAWEVFGRGADQRRAAAVRDPAADGRHRDRQQLGA